MQITKRFFYRFLSIAHSLENLSILLCQNQMVVHKKIDVLLIRTSYHTWDNGEQTANVREGERVFQLIEYTGPAAFVDRREFIHILTLWPAFSHMRAFGDRLMYLY